MLIVIGIIALLIGLLLPVIRSVQGAAKSVVCGSNLRQIGIAMSAYSLRGGQMLPYAGIIAGAGNGQPLEALGPDLVVSSWDDLLNKDLGGDLTEAEQRANLSPRAVRSLICPSDDKARWFTVPHHKMSYGVVAVRDLTAMENRFLGTAGVASVDDWPAAARMTEKISFRSSDIRRPSETLAVVDYHFPLNAQGYFPNHIVEAWSVYMAEGYLKPPHRGRYNVLYHDGHVAAVVESETLGAGTPNNPRGQWTRAVGD